MTKTRGRRGSRECRGRAKEREWKRWSVERTVARLLSSLRRNILDDSCESGGSKRNGTSSSLDGSPKTLAVTITMERTCEGGHRGRDFRYRFSMDLQDRWRKIDTCFCWKECVFWMSHRQMVLSIGWTFFSFFFFSKVSDNLNKFWENFHASGKREKFIFFLSFCFVFCFCFSFGTSEKTNLEKRIYRSTTHSLKRNTNEFCNSR